MSRIASFIRSWIFYVLCYVKLRDFEFKFIGKNIINTGWSEVTCYFKVQLPIQNIYASVKNNNKNITMAISDTPHYQYISSIKGKDVYFKYKKENFGLEKKYVESKFDNLITSINKSGIRNQVLISKDMILPNRKCANILDGVHRSAVLLSKNHTNIECYIVHMNKILK
ncbi:hypothetical protein N9H64_04605 [Acidimicrobiia bacterium]|nr:hypothetical protein [Acidimicrobiia bacterium]